MQKEFMKSQYELTCEYLNISPNFDGDDITLFEAVYKLLVDNANNSIDNPLTPFLK